MRSATAQKIFENNLRYEVRSAGTNINATVVLSEELLNWADAIVVMERSHKYQIKKGFPEIFKNKPIACLYIEDHYEFMQRELIYALEDKFEDVVEKGLWKVSKV